MLEASLEELIWAWQDCSPLARLEALVGQKKILEEIEPGLHAQLKAQLIEHRKAEKEAMKLAHLAEAEAQKAERQIAQEAAKQARKIQVELARRERSIPIEIRKIQRSLKRLTHRDKKQQKNLQKVQDKLTQIIIKQIRTES